MSGNEMNAFCCETESDSSMPVWKREILERRKAKRRETFDLFSSSFAARVNGEIYGKNGHSAMIRRPPNKSFSIASDSRHLVGKRSFTPAFTTPLERKDSCSASENCDVIARDKNVCCHREQEKLVLSDSLGPLHDNPFIKMERQRKMLQEQENAARSVQHILELYGSAPGIRTIRAENIIIIESDPDYLLESTDFKFGPKLEHSWSSSSMEDLLDRKCTAVTEIHAKEVVIYDSKMSRSEENLSSFGHFDNDGELLHIQGQSRVSRILKKFDCNYDKCRSRSCGSEDLLVADTGSDRLRLKSKLQFDPVPKSTMPRGSDLHALSPEQVHAFQSSKSSQYASKVPSFIESQGSGVPSSVFLQSGEEGECKKMLFQTSPASPLGEKGRDALMESSKPKIASFSERSRLSPAYPSCCPSPNSSTFEIRPAPQPDLSKLPVDDLQARALANLRLQSRNSFTVIPKRRMLATSSGGAEPSNPIRPTSSPCPNPREPELQVKSVAEPTPPGLPSFLPVPPRIHKEMVPSHSVVEASERDGSLSRCSPSYPSAMDISKDHPIQALLPKEPPFGEQLPITNIDDVVVEPTQSANSFLVHQRKGNTFTVVPKSRPAPQHGPPVPREAATDLLSSTQGPKQPPYAELGSLLKKRYPKAEDIEVIGGYLSLSRSCLSKTPTRKELKISFNESSLHSTFEYPSETSLSDGGEGENEEGEEEALATRKFWIPRPSYLSSPTKNSGSTDLSNYTHKHSADLSASQEHKHDVQVLSPDCTTETAETTLQEVMLTPADGSTLSDFHSDPTLYF